MPVKKATKKEEPPNVDSDFLRADGKKDPNLAALIALGAMFIIGLPSLAYLYVGNSRKALVYSIGLVGGSVALLIFAILIGMLTFGIGLLLFVPIVILILVFEIVIVIDVYKIAKGEKALLPNL